MPPKDVHHNWIKDVSGGQFDPAAHDVGTAGDGSVLVAESGSRPSAPGGAPKPAHKSHARAPTLHEVLSSKDVLDSIRSMKMEIAQARLVGAVANAYTNELAAISDVKTEFELVLKKKLEDEKKFAEMVNFALSVGLMILVPEYAMAGAAFSAAMKSRAGKILEIIDQRAPTLHIDFKAQAEIVEFVGMQFSAEVAKKGIEKLVDKGKESIVKKAMVSSDSPEGPLFDFQVKLQNAADEKRSSLLAELADSTSVDPDVVMAAALCLEHTKIEHYKPGLRTLFKDFTEEVIPLLQDINKGAHTTRARSYGDIYETTTESRLFKVTHTPSGRDQYMEVEVKSVEAATFYSFKRLITPDMEDSVASKAEKEPLEFKQIIDAPR